MRVRRAAVVAQIKAVIDWMAERHVALAELVAASALDDRVVDAIVHGRYTPSPEQRRRLAAALGVAPEQVAWGTRPRSSTSTGTGRSSAAVPEESAMADAGKTVDQLCAEHRIDARQLAERSGVDEQRAV